MANEFSIKRGDTSPSIKYQITLGEGQTLTGASATFKMRGVNDSALKVDASAAVDDSTNVLSYTWAASDTDTAGMFKAEFQVTYADSKIETFPNTEYIQINVISDLD